MKSPDFSESVIKTDVLVIGGGLAGCFAAVKARELGAEVTIVSKGNIGRSGQTPWADATFIFSPDWKDKFDELSGHTYSHGEYMNNRDWTERVFNESYDRFRDLESWGVEFIKDEKGDYRKITMGGQVHPGLMWSPPGTIGAWVKPLRTYPKKIGINIIEKVMVVDLIKNGDRITGAVGFSTINPDIYIFEAKAVVICTGAGGFKPIGAWPIADLTADGQIMAYKAGAEITGKEFEDFHSLMTKKTGFITLPDFEREGPGDGPFAPIYNSEGNEPPDFGFGLSGDFEAHAGRIPLIREGEEFFSNVALGMSVHTAEGIWPVDEYCASGIPGLYAAGDSCATMVTGSRYGLGGAGTATASVTGARAGKAAAEFVKNNRGSEPDKKQLDELKAAVMEPINRKGGFTPGWVTQQLKNIMMPYYTLRVKKGDRLQAILTLVEFMKENLCPKIMARDPHELRLAHETNNMIINAEMKLRSSLFRTESRGMHYREDFPRRDDSNWLAWVMLKEENGRMVLSKRPIPEKWHPDLSMPYEKRYPSRFPGE